jgi:hypothetical protein
VNEEFEIIFSEFIQARRVTMAGSDGILRPSKTPNVRIEQPMAQETPGLRRVATFYS